jgi:hypothetical protein
MRRRRQVPVSYDTFRQRVRRHRRSELLVATAALNTRLTRAEFGQDPSLDLPNFFQPFSLGGIARTALVSANDHRSAPVTVNDLAEMCWLYGNIDEPVFQREPGRDRLRYVFNHIAYEQFGHQHSAMENVGRTLCLLADQAVVVPSAPSENAWRDSLGVPLELFMRLGFAMHIAALSNGGAIKREVLKMDHVAPIFAPLSPDDALAVIDRWFAAPPEQLQQAGAAEEIRGSEKWSLSPLVNRPVVTLPDGRYVMPWPRLVLDRITPTGLYFIGLELFGSAFTDSLGLMFENYVGAQLELLEHATVIPEIIYGKSNEKTVDFFVVAPEVVVLIEAKAARPIRATRLGEPDGDEDTAKKVGYAFTQIERTAELIRNGHPALAAIPNDRPVLGLVVTLEPFYLLNTDFYEDVFERPSIPTTVAYAHEFEGTVAALRSEPDVGRRLLEALSGASGRTALLTDAADGLVGEPNPLLAHAWERFSGGWRDLLDS